MFSLSPLPVIAPSITHLILPSPSQFADIMSVPGLYSPNSRQAQVPIPLHHKHSIHRISNYDQSWILTSQSPKSKLSPSPYSLTKCSCWTMAPWATTTPHSSLLLIDCKFSFWTSYKCKLQLDPIDCKSSFLEMFLVSLIKVRCLGLCLTSCPGRWGPPGRSSGCPPAPPDGPLTLTPPDPLEADQHQTWGRGNICRSGRHHTRRWSRYHRGNTVRPCCLSLYLYVFMSLFL